MGVSDAASWFRERRLKLRLLRPTDSRVFRQCWGRAKLLPMAIGLLGLLTLSMSTTAHGANIPIFLNFTGPDSVKAGQSTQLFIVASGLSAFPANTPVAVFVNVQTTDPTTATPSDFTFSVQQLPSFNASSDSAITIAITGGNDPTQVQQEKTTLATPFGVQVMKGTTPSPAYPVSWTVTSGGGTLSNGNSTATDGSGKASNTLTLGPAQSNPNQVNACLKPEDGGGCVTFKATATPAPPLGISIVSGNNQTGVINAKLANPFVVSVTQGGAKAPPGTPVTWQIASGGGTLSPCTTQTDGNGQASCSLALGPTLGAVTVKASTKDGFVTFSVNDATQAAVTGLKQFSAMGNVALSTAQVQATNIGLRLANLRRGASGVSLGGLSLGIDGQPIPLSAVASLIPGGGRGGGASADRSVLGNLGVFLNGQGSFGDQQASNREPGFDFHTAGLTAGADYKLTNQLILGAAFGYLNTKTDFDAGAGNMHTNGYSLSAYGSYYLTDKFYLDGIATYGWNGYDTTRNITVSDISESAKASPDGTQFALSVNGGYNFNFGAVTVGPSLRANYIRVHIDSFTERGADLFNLSVNSQTVESVTTALGGQVSYAISTPWGVVLPLARFEWEHEYKGGSRLITGSLVADPLRTQFSVPTNNPDRDYFNLGAGISATLKAGASAFVYYETVLGRDRIANHSFTGGVRFEF